MNASRFLVLLLLSACIISSIICPSFGAENNISNNTEMNNSIDIQSDISTNSIIKAQDVTDKEEYLVLANQNLDRSLGLLNSVLSSIMTLLTIITVFLAMTAIVVAISIPIAAYFLKWVYGKIIAAKTEVEEIRDEADKTHKELTKILVDAKKQATYLNAKIGGIPIEKEPSKETLKKLQDFDTLASSFNLLETFGVELSFDDYFNLASSMFYKNKLEESLFFINKALSINPDDIKTLVNKSLILSRLNQYSQSMKTLNKANEIDPNNTNIWSAIGYVYSDCGKHEKGLKAYSKAIEINPNNLEAWNGRGTILARLGQYKESIESFEQALKINSHDVRVLSNIAASLCNTEEYEKALESVEKAIILDPNYGTAWLNKACIFSKQGNKEKAIDTLKTAIELNPSIKEKAKYDDDFNNIRGDPDFRKLVFDE